LSVHYNVLLYFELKELNFIKFPNERKRLSVQGWVGLHSVIYVIKYVIFTAKYSRVISLVNVELVSDISALSLSSGVDLMGVVLTRYVHGVLEVKGHRGTGNYDRLHESLSYGGHRDSTALQ
jgi:hypothetical protein